jgi:hypothetical protein
MPCYTYSEQNISLPRRRRSCDNRSPIYLKKEVKSSDTCSCDTIFPGVGAGQIVIVLTNLPALSTSTHANTTAYRMCNEFSDFETPLSLYDTAGTLIGGPVYIVSIITGILTIVNSGANISSRQGCFALVATNWNRSMQGLRPWQWFNQFYSAQNSSKELSNKVTLIIYKILIITYF